MAERSKRHRSCTYDEEPSRMEEERSFAVAVLEREKAEGSFGWAWFQCKCMGCCLNPWCFLACLCLLSVAYGYGRYGIFPASITHLERRMNFRMLEIAFIHASCDIGYISSLIPFLLNATRRSHRPQWIGAGGLLMCAGAILCTLAHFTAPMVQEEQHDPAYCSTANTTRTPPTSKGANNDCEERSPKEFQLFALAFGYFMIGIGAAPISVLGVTYLDEHASHYSMSAVFTGILAIAELSGPALGYLSSMQLSRWSGDVEKTGSFAKGNAPNPNHRQWYGAWWLGMFINAGIALIGAVWAYGFPQELPGSFAARLAAARLAAYRRKLIWYRRRRRRHRSPSPALIVSPQKLAKKAEKKERREAIKAVLCNGAFWGLVLEQGSTAAMVNGFAMLGPKYMEIIFGRSARGSVFYSIATIYVCAIIGLLFGTLFQRLMRLKIAGTIRLALLGAAGTVLFSAGFLVICPTVEMAGVTVPYPGQTARSMKLEAACNERCHCSDNYFDPVCFYANDSERLMYFSRCFGGCPRRNMTNAWECTCFNASRLTARPKSKTGKKCTGCPKAKKAAFVIGVGWLAISAYIRKNPAQQAIMRCVPFNSRIVALAVSTAAMRLSGIAGTVIMGPLVKVACRKETNPVCGASPICSWYDATTLSLVMVGFSAALGCMSIYGLISALILRKKVEPLQSPSTTSLSSPSLSDASSQSMSMSSLEYEYVVGLNKERLNKPV